MRNDVQLIEFAQPVPEEPWNYFHLLKLPPNNEIVIYKRVYYPGMHPACITFFIPSLLFVLLPKYFVEA